MSRVIESGTDVGASRCPPSDVALFMGGGSGTPDTTEQPTAPSPRPMDTTASGRTYSILVVDDEPQIRRAVRNALRDVAERVIEATTAAEAIDLAAAEQPDLVVLDLGLPDQPGIEVCREIRRWATTPIVVLSARHSEIEKVHLLDAGADDYITKPFSLLEFEARIRVQLRRAVAAPRAEIESPMSIGTVVIDF